MCLGGEKLLFLYEVQDAHETPKGKRQVDTRLRLQREDAAQTQKASVRTGKAVGYTDLLEPEFDRRQPSGSPQV